MANICQTFEITIKELCYYTENISDDTFDEVNLLINKILKSLKKRIST